MLTFPMVFLYLLLASVGSEVLPPVDYKAVSKAEVKIQEQVPQTDSADKP